MGKRLIINADDFGLSEAVNYGILKAFKKGIVTSTTIMANMPGFDHAIMLAKENPDMHIGVHLTLTSYKPVLQNLTHIVSEDGYFHSQSEINEINTEEAYKELKAQIDKVIQRGIHVDHFDSHHHIHAYPVLKDVINRLYEEYKLPFRGGFAYASNIPQTCSDIRYYGDVSVDDLCEILHTLKEDKVNELMCHPAYIDKFLYQITSYALKRIEELDVLCNSDIKEYMKKEGIQCISYQDL